jgi:hypothetical protein
MKKLVFLVFLGLIFVLPSCEELRPEVVEITGIVKSLDVRDTLAINFTDGRRFELREMPNCQIDQGSEVKMFGHRLSPMYNNRITIDSFVVVRPAPKR